jgi:tetraacyldisaccharide 4'-kinase
MQEQVPALQAVVLDDAFQHRRVDAGLDILLTTWHRPWHRDALLPAGRLRDLPSRARFADVVVVTKCPGLPSAEERQGWRKELGLGVGQELFFSGIRYDVPRSVGRPSGSDTYRRTLQDLRGELGAMSETQILLITGIADPAPLLAHVQGLFAKVEHAAFPDHYRFTEGDLQGLAARCAKFAPGPKMLLTTEKDATRLLPLLPGSALQDFPLAVIAMQAVILNEPERFAALIRDHVATHPAHR